MEPLFPIFSRRGCSRPAVAPCTPVNEPSTYSLVVPCSPSTVVSPTIVRGVDSDPLKRALGDKTYADVVPEIRERLRSNSWATEADKDAIKYTERVLKPGESPGFAKEVTFEAKPSAVTPHFDTVRFGHDDYGRFYRAEWKYQTGASNLIKIYGGDWEVKLERSADGHRYSVKFPDHFVGAVKLTIDGKSHIVYSHATSETVPAASKVKDEPKKEVGSLKLPDPKADAALEKERQKLAAERADLEKQRKELDAAKAKFEADKAQQALLNKQREEALEKQRQELAKWKSELDRTSKGLDQQREAAKKERGELDLAKQRLAEGNADLKKREGDLATERASLTALSGELGKKSDDLKAEAKRLTGLRATLSNTEATLTAQADELKKQQGGLKDLKATLDAQKLAQDARGAALDKRSGELDVKEKELGERDKKIKEGEAGLAALDKKLKEDSQLKADERKKLEDQQKDLAERLKNEREQLEKDRKALTGLQDDLKKQRTELDDARKGLAALQKDLETRGGALDKREGELKSESDRLGELRKKLADQEAALKEKAELTRDRSVSSPPTTLAERPKLNWDAPAVRGDAAVDAPPLGTPELKLPAWLRFASVANFEREALEGAFAKMTGSFESYLAAGDYDRQTALVAAADKLTGEKKAAYDAAKRSHATHIVDAYRPIMDAYGNTQDAIVALAKLQRDYKGAVPPAEEVEAVQSKIDRADKALRVALYGADRKLDPEHFFEGVKDDERSGEYLAGLSAKAKKIRIDIDVLEKQPTRDKAEETRLAFLRDRLLRMEESEKWLRELEPHMKRIVAGRADPMKIDLNGPKAKEAPLGEPSKLLDTLKAPVTKLVAGEVDEPSLTAIKATAAVKPTTPAEVVEKLGASPALDRSALNLERALETVKGDAYREQLVSRSYNARWSKAADILSVAEPLAARKIKVVGFFTGELGRKLTDVERAELERGCDAFEAAPSKEKRTEALATLMTPLRLQSEERAKSDQSKAVEALQSSLDTIKSGKATVAFAGLAKTTDQRFIEFVTKAPGYGDQTTEGTLYREESKYEAAKVEAKAAQVVALQAIEAELKELEKVTEGKRGSTAVHHRVELLQQRRKSLNRWLARQNGKFTAEDD